MKEKILIIASIICAAVVLYTATAMAQNQIKLLVNGKVIEPDVAPQIIDGRTMVPIRWVAEALGAKVDWNNETKTASIVSAVSEREQQIHLLEQGYAADTPLKAVQTWAEAVKNRNGAVQFALLSPELKEKTRDDYEKINWVTGVSSPWVEEYFIIDDEQADEDIHSYRIEFQMQTSTGPAGLLGASVKVKEIDGVWLITEVQRGPEGIPNLVPEGISREYVLDVIHQMELGLSQSEITQVFGMPDAEVLSALDGSPMWRYDYAEEPGYTFETEIINGTTMDSVDREGLQSGALRMQLFINWSDKEEAHSYALYFKNERGAIMNYRYDRDGKIHLK